MPPLQPIEEMEPVAPATGLAGETGLRRDILSPTETLAQSISTIAPTTTPTMTIPLVFALAGNGTWLAYVFALGAILLIAFCVNRFACKTCSAGSLYTYVSDSLPPLVSAIAGWALLLAYVATGAAVAGGFINYANVFALSLLHRTIPVVLLAIVCVGITSFVAHRNVQISARLMLWIEASSVCFIAVVLVVLLWKNGIHIDPAQIGLHSVKASGVRLGVVLAIFSFVGFESATTLGDEAVHPLRTIPRAVIQSAIFVGIFFILCAYLETLGMATAHQNLGEATAPMHVLAAQAGMAPLGPFIDLGALVSLFSCTLACITAAARVLLRMAQNGLAHASFGKAHRKNATPGAAVVAVGILTFVPVAILAARGVSGMDIYGWLGSLSVYGFLTTYALVAIALPVFLKRRGELNVGARVLAWGAAITMLLALAGTLYPVPTERPYNWLPYLYLAYILCGVGWWFYRSRRAVAA